MTTRESIRLYKSAIKSLSKPCRPVAAAKFIGVKIEKLINGKVQYRPYVYKGTRSAINQTKAFDYDCRVFDNPYAAAIAHDIMFHKKNVNCHRLNMKIKVNKNPTTLNFPNGVPERLWGENGVKELMVELDACLNLDPAGRLDGEEVA